MTLRGEFYTRKRIIRGRNDCSVHNECRVLCIVAVANFAANVTFHDDLTVSAARRIKKNQERISRNLRSFRYYEERRYLSFLQYKHPLIY